MTYAELPAAGRPRPERADAARNRERVLAAARRLFAERGVDAVTMEAVARAAGVAKGTVFHRFGDRAGLALALLDEHERRSRSASCAARRRSGPARRRVSACERSSARSPSSPSSTITCCARSSGGDPPRGTAPAPTRAWLQHTVLLLGDDDALRAHLLLAPLAADLVWHLAEQGASAADLTATLHGLL